MFSALPFLNVTLLTMTNYFTTAFLHPKKCAGKCYTNSSLLTTGGNSRKPPDSSDPESRGKSCLPALVLAPVQTWPVPSPEDSHQSRVLGRLLLCQRRQVVFECL